MYEAGLFANQKILVAGGSGLGRGMAKKFLSFSAQLAIFSRREQLCRASADQIMAQLGGTVTAHKLDIHDPAATGFRVTPMRWIRRRPAALLKKPTTQTKSCAKMLRKTEKSGVRKTGT